MAMASILIDGQPRKHRPTHAPLIAISRLTPARQRRSVFFQ
jgi:hypothetical protein